MAKVKASAHVQNYCIALDWLTASTRLTNQGIKGRLMARKAFTGDHIKELPKGKMEPYRLWFEFLKLALEIQPNKVDREFYKPWGDVSKEKFNDWFPKNWQRLFATPASLTVVGSISEAKEYLDDPNSVLIRIDRSGPVKRQIEDFKKVQKSQRVVYVKPQSLRPAFEITSNRSMNNASTRAMLKLLSLHHKHNSKIDEATKEYYKWASEWNKNIRDKKWKREPIRIPVVLSAFAGEIEKHEKHEKRKATSSTRVKKEDEYYMARSDAGRFLRKAKKILDNVSSGKYPGMF